MDADTIYEVVKSLIGEIDPTGDHGVDQLRLERLNRLIELLDKLISDLDWISRNRYNEAASIKAIGEAASNYLKELDFKVQRPDAR